MRPSAIVGCLLFLSCAPELAAPPAVNRAAQLSFGPQVAIGNTEANPSTPFLRHSPDGRLFAVWIEDHETPWPEGKHSGGGAHMKGDRGPSPMRNALIASSSDNGKSWSSRRRVNSEVEAVQGEENGPKVAFDSNNRAYVVWSIPGSKGDKTRANIRFAMEESGGSFTRREP